MPVGAIIGGVASIGGALLSSRAQSKAANKAADAAQDTAQMNNALQRDIYGQNQAVLNPYVTRGNEAGSAINALLGIAGTAPAAGSPGAPAGYSGPSLDAIMAMQNDGIPGNFEPALAAYHAAQGAPAQAPAAAPANPQAPQQAFQNYLGSTGYQFQMDQGNKAINQGYAAKGALQSGAALKALQTYGQNTATGFFKDYLGLLSNQQGVGLSGANAIAGVGTNYANSVSANNNNAGYVNAAAALGAGQANANMYGGIANAIGGIANNAFGSSYRQPPVQTPYMTDNAMMIGAPSFYAYR